MTTEREPRTEAPLVGRPPRGSEVHLQHDHDIRQSLCGDGVTGGDAWELDDLCPKCWDQARAEAAREALERAARRVMLLPGRRLGIDEVLAAIEESSR